MTDQDKTSAHSSKPILKSGRQLDALRACALYSGGMRAGAFPTAMRQLAGLGLVEERPIRARNRATAWFITPAGRDEMAKHHREAATRSWAELTKEKQSLSGVPAVSEQVLRS